MSDFSQKNSSEPGLKTLVHMQGQLTISIFIAVTIVVFSAFRGNQPDTEQHLSGPGEKEINTVSVGAERLLDEYFDLIKNKRVGIITNHSAIAGGQHIVDLLHERDDVEVTALFGPEHGIRGTADAGEHVADDIDEDTGIPVFSLYGETRRPSLEMLENVDVLIFDIQDVGTRFYTYPATMGRAMRSAVEAGIPYLVLDRPNPIGGFRIEGHIRKDEFVSGIGLYPTPITHGMTVGELALMIHDQGWHEGIEDLDLHVIEMDGWNRDMLWEDTGLDWIPPSPNIPDFETAVVYPGTCFFEGTPASEGRGTYEPFLQVGSPHIDEEKAAEELNRRADFSENGETEEEMMTHNTRESDLGGLRFHPVIFTPESIPGMSREPKLEGELVRGVRLEVTDSDSVRPVAAGIHILQVFYDLLPEEQQAEFFHPRGMPVRAGNKYIQQMIRDGVPATEIIESWTEDVERFTDLRGPYLIYD